MENQQFCLECGQVSPSQARFCPQCGVNLTEMFTDLSCYEGFSQAFNGLLYHERKFELAGKLMMHYLENAASKEDKAKLKEEPINNWVSLFLYDAVASGNEFSLLRLALGQGDTIEAKLKTAANWVNMMFWNKLFETRQFNILSYQRLINEADEVLPHLRGVINATEGNNTLTSAIKLYREYSKKIEPYEGTLHTKYFCYLKALSLTTAETEAEEYADRLSSWITAYTDNILDKAIELHQADYLECYRLDEEIKTQLRATCKEMLLNSAKEYLEAADKAFDTVQKPIIQAVIALQTLEDEGNLKDEEGNPTAPATEAQTELENLRPTIFAKAEKKEGQWEGGILSILRAIFFEHMSEEAYGAEFLTEFVNSIFADLTSHGAEPQELEAYLE